MKISVIVPVHNRETLIAQCLNSLCQQTIDEYEVIVVDDGSTDRTADIISTIKDERIRLLRNIENKGLAFSRNKGVAESHGDIIAFIDSDCTAYPDWLTKLTEPFSKDQDIMITGGRIMDPPAQTYWELVNNGTDTIASKSGYVKHVVGCNMAFRREFLMENLFELDHADERDLCLICLSKKKRIFYDHNAPVTHYHRKNLKETLIQHFRWGQYNAILNLKHRVMPFFSYGSLLLLMIGILAWTKNAPTNIIWTLTICYLTITGYWNTRMATRTWKEWILTYPGYLLSFTTFCAGNLIFFIRTPSSLR